MAKEPSIQEERAEARQDRMAEAYWTALATKDPGLAGVATGNARDAAAAARQEDIAADRQQQQAPSRGRSLRP